MKRLPASLRTVSRKIKTGIVYTLFLALSLVPARYLFGQGALLSAEMKEEEAVVNLRMVEAREKRLVENAFQGRTSRVYFDFRIYRRTKGVAALFGDRIEKEQSITKQGHWDPFSSQFIITSSDGASWRALRPNDYLDSLLSVEDYLVELPHNRGDYYLLARIRLKEINLQVPFNLLDPILPETRVTSPWVRWEFSFGEEI